MLRNLLLAGLTVLVSVSCGGGGDEDEPPPDPGTITIENPSTDTYVAGPTATSVILAGIAFNANLITNCFIGGQQNLADIGTTVTWVNAAGGNGTASQSVNCSSITGTGANGWLCANTGGGCRVGYHNWTATIPIVPGTNVVTMTATGSRGVAHDTITITR
jgi:hypothetical protein